MTENQQFTVKIERAKKLIENLEKLDEKIATLSKTHGKFGENIYIVDDANHACGPNSDRLWQAYAVRINDTSADFGKVTWDFGDMESYDEIDDAGSYPWDDESIMDFEKDSEFDLTDNDETEELLMYTI